MSNTEDNMFAVLSSVFGIRYSLTAVQAGLFCVHQGFAIATIGSVH